MNLTDGKLSHLDERNLPTMVDVTDKDITFRSAKAQALVQLPPAVAASLQGDELVLKKGPVFQTAIIAGTMATKRTAELIPFCHPLPIEGCKIRITMDAQYLVTITCEVKTTGKTGVEIEALTGASVAALTVYDMVKALSHEIVLRETRLIAKTGGKRTVLDLPTYGLVLTGGKSTRMQDDKALLEYQGEPHAKVIRDLLLPHCKEVYLSAREGQWMGTPLQDLPTVVDSAEIAQQTAGPLLGILSAFARHPDANWWVVACDLAHFDETAIQSLLAHYAADSLVTCFKNREEDFPEPLCALYSPRARAVFSAAVQADMRCPVKILRNAPGVRAIAQPAGVDLANINTREEYRAVRGSARA